MSKKQRVILVLLALFIPLSYLSASSGPEVISEEKAKIIIGYCPFGMMQTSVAKAREFHKKYLPNVEVEWEFGLYSIHLINKWIEGGLEIAYLGDMPAIILQSRLRNTKWVSVAVSARGKVASIFVPNDSPIKSIEQLDGKSIATGIGSSHHRILKVFGAAEGIRFKVINRTPDEVMVDLKERKVDAACCWPPYVELIKYHHIARMLLPDFTKYEPEVNAIWPLIVSERFAREHPLIVKGLARADRDLHRFMVEQPDKAAEIVYKELEEAIPLSVVKASLATYGYTEKLGEEQIETMQKGIDFLTSEGFIKEGLKAADWLDGSFSK